ncbi:cardiolipin synthase [Siculibacillus lacustris]|nr:cardiolipin synthase [Siculibacillus lacustris]
MTNAATLEYAFLGLHTVLFLTVSLRVVGHNLAPSTGLAWILLVALFPVGGFLLYVLVGERPLGRLRLRRMVEGHRPFLARFAALPAGAFGDLAALTVEQGQLARLGTATSGIPLLRCDRVDVIAGADTILKAIVADLNGARRACDLIFYIWQDGGLADGVADALERAARRGVRCRVLLDAVGSRPFFRGERIARLRAAGVRIEAALPVGPIRALFVRADLRLHRKLLIVDGRIAYTGSMNLVDPHVFRREAGVGEWVDAMIRIEGPPVVALETVFLEDWLAETGELPTPPVHPLAAWAEVPAVTVGAAAVVPSGPDLVGDDIRRLVLAAAYGATRELVVTTPYFVPDEAVTTALESAAMRGVTVTLIVPEQVDSRLVRYASRSFFDGLLASGVRIHQFQGGLLHTKSLTVDGETTLFGTFNLDIRSLRLNFEITLVVFDPAVTAAVRALQADYERRSVAVDLIAWRARSPVRRFVENLVRLASPLL